MSHHYRCSRCRTRNVWPKALHDYAKGRRCRHCSYQRFYVDKERVNRKPCHCLGLHFPHRPKTKCCEQHPRFQFDQAVRAGMCPIEAAWDGLGAIESKPGATCPF